MTRTSKSTPIVVLGGLHAFTVEGDVKARVDLILENDRFSHFRSYEWVDLGNFQESLLVDVLACPSP